MCFQQHATTKLILYYLSISPGDFVDDVGKHDILVVCVGAQFLPLRVLAESNVVSEKWVADAVGGLVG